MIAGREGKTQEEVEYVIPIPSDRVTTEFTLLSISEIVGEFGRKPLYRSLGYFSLIGLLRVHVLLGDYTLALKVIDNIELTPKVYSFLWLLKVPDF